MPGVRREQRLGARERGARVVVAAQPVQHVRAFDGPAHDGDGRVGPVRRDPSLGRRLDDPSLALFVMLAQSETTLGLGRTLIARICGRAPAKSGG